MKKSNLIIPILFTLLISFTFLSFGKSNGQTGSSSNSSGATVECFKGTGEICADSTMCLLGFPISPFGRSSVSCSDPECNIGECTRFDQGDDCKCPIRFNSNLSTGMCIYELADSGTFDFNFVCGCDGNTYPNVSTLKNAGLKKFTQGQCIPGKLKICGSACRCEGERLVGNCDTNICCFESSSSSSGECIICTQVVPDCSSDEILIPQTCNECAHCTPASSSSSGDLSCTTDDDCPPGICSSSGTFKNSSCLEGNCHQIFYFADPCQFQSSSSSGDLITLNKNFSGIWKGKIPNDGHTKSKIITLTLCVKEQELNGIVNIPGDIKKGIIVSQNIISTDEISITIRSESNLEKELNLKLTNKKHLLVSIDSSQAFEVKEIRSNNKCKKITSTSGEICPIIDCAAPPEGCQYSSHSTSSGCPKDCGELICTSSGCTSKGSCRGENGAELSCPSGTECSGLPAYGCYPPGCPVPLCCSPDTKIRTDGVQKRIADIRKGEIVLTDAGKAVRVKKVSKTPVKNHKMLKVLLNDGTILEVSPGHPTADGRKFKDLKIRDLLDDRMVVEIRLIPYLYSHTYDILPDSKTGNYYANGVLIGSTLK